MREVDEYIQNIIFGSNSTPLAEIFEIRKYPKGFTFGPHSHYNLEINFVKKGSCKMQFDNEIVNFKMNDCMIIYPNEEHYFYVDKQPAELVQLEFRLDIFPNLKPAPEMEEHMVFLYNVLTNSHRYLKISCNSHLMQLIEHIVEELNQKRENFALLTRLYYAELFLIISRYLAETLKFIKEPKNDIVNKAIRIIHSQYSEDITIEKLAAGCDISARYLRKLFVKELGIPPIEYIIAIRINNAKELLRNTPFSLKEIAFSTGFYNQHYFSKRFKQCTGMSPLEYRHIIVPKIIKKEL